MLGSLGQLQGHGCSATSWRRGVFWSENQRCRSIGHPEGHEGHVQVWAAKVHCQQLRSSGDVPAPDVAVQIVACGTVPEGIRRSAPSVQQTQRPGFRSFGVDATGFQHRLKTATETFWNLEIGTDKLLPLWN